MRIQKSLPKLKKGAWFVRIRGSYLPMSPQAWLTYIPYIAYMVGVLIFVIQRKEPFWLAVFIAVPNWVAASFIMTWVAKQKS